MDDKGAPSTAPQTLGQRFGNRDAAVLAARAADADGRVAAAFVQVALDDGLQECHRPIEKVLGPRLGQHIVTDRLVPPGQRLQLGHPEGIGEESQVEDEVGVQGDAVLETEGHDGDAESGAAVIADHRTDLASQLVHVETRGVEDHICLGSQLAQQLALGLDTVEEASTTLQRVRSTHALEAPDEGLVGGVEKEQLRAPRTFFQGDQRVVKLVEELLGPDVDDRREFERHPSPARLLPEHDQGGEQLRRQIVDDVPAAVLQHVCGRAAPGPAHPGDEQQLGRVVRDQIVTHRPAPPRS